MKPKFVNFLSQTIVSSHGKLDQIDPIIVIEMNSYWACQLEMPKYIPNFQVLDNIVAVL